MKTLISFLITVLLATTAQAQTGYIIHGIDGRDLGLAQNVPVDIVLNGYCDFKGIGYQQVIGPATIIANSYDVQVRASTGSCSGAILATGQINVAALENFTILAHLNEQGSPTISKFTNDLRTTEATKARLIVRHGAGLEPVQLRYRRLQGSFGTTFGGYLPIIQNGAQQAVELNPGKFTASVYSTVGFRRRVAGSEVTLADDKFLAVYAVGSFKKNTFALILQTLDTVK